jgi:antitoxin component YwqK of YwqJK toxin-antitoxin module
MNKYLRIAVQLSASPSRTGALVILLMLIGLAGFKTFYAPGKLDQARREELALRDGRLYRGNVPFTGNLVEHYPDGKLKSRSQSVAGRFEGVSEGWYPNGNVQVREHFKAGISHGARTKWYENGQIMSETTIRDGKHDGTFKRWHENGQLAEAVEMSAGEAHGVSLAYYPSGFLKARAVLEKGKIFEQTSWKDGEKRSFEERSFRAERSFALSP